VKDKNKVSLFDSLRVNARHYISGKDLSTSFLLAHSSPQHLCLSATPPKKKKKNNSSAFLYSFLSLVIVVIHHYHSNPTKKKERETYTYPGTNYS
jgi:hypothetical protein